MGVEGVRVGCKEAAMRDTLRYAKVVTMLGLVLVAAAIGVRDGVHWLAGSPRTWAIEDRHLRLSVEESQGAKDEDEPYKGGKFQAQYEKL